MLLMSEFCGSGAWTGLSFISCKAVVKVLTSWAVEESTYKLTLVVGRIRVLVVVRLRVMTSCGGGRRLPQQSPCASFYYTDSPNMATYLLRPVSRVSGVSLLANGVLYYLI